MGGEKITPGTLFAESYQMNAIIKGIKLGEKIQKDFPEVASLYTKNFSVLDIVKYFDLVNFYSQVSKICESGVYWSLRGYNESLEVINHKVGSYPGLLSIEEIKRIARENNSLSAKAIAKKSLENKTGIFSLSKEERIENGKKGAKSCGFVIYSNREIEYIKKLSNKKKYLHVSGKNVGNLKMSDICCKVNKKIHNGKSIRNARAIAKIIKKKKLSCFIESNKKT